MTPTVRRFFSGLSRISPQLAGRLAHQLFSTPLPVGRLSAAERRLEARAKVRLAKAERIEVPVSGGRIIGYRIGTRGRDTGKTIVLVHGWMSSARYMLALADELAALGDEVICFDLPAHGESSGFVTGLVPCANALKAVVDRVGPIDMIVAHSFGGAVTAYATSVLGLKLAGSDPRIILLASPNRLSVVTQRFGDAIGLSAAAREVYEARLMVPLGGDLNTMDGNRLYAGGVALRIIHCTDDAEVPYSEGQRFTELGEQVKLMPLSDIGHRRILYAPKALAAVREARGAA